MKYIENIGPRIDIKLYNIEFDYKQIAKEILSQKHSKVNNNPMSTGYEDYTLKYLPNSESSKFVNYISNYALDKNFSLSGIWSHIHYPLESTNTHNHGIGGLSFVYYVQVPKNSGLFVVDLQQGYRHSIIPKEGTLLLFQSWVPHLVTKNLSNDIRISISGNFKEIE